MIHAVIDAIRDHADDPDDVGRAAALCAAVEAHTAEQFRRGVEIETLVGEYAQLRHASRERAIDFAIAVAVKKYVALRSEQCDRYLGVLAHDLRTPLSCVAMAAEMLRNDSPQKRTIIDTMLNASDRMRRLVTDVLAWARESRGMSATLRVEDFGRIVREVVQEACVAYGETAVAVSLDGDLRGWFDRDRVHQAIGNLVMNAIEHGAGTAQVEAMEVDGGNAVLLVVRNRGLLRSPSSSDVIDLRRAKRPTSSRGFGLYIVDEIARAHGAAVEVSTYAEDVVVSIRWPTRRYAADAVTAPVPKRE